MDDELGVWVSEANEHHVIHEADRLELVGTFADTAIMLTEDEFGALFERSFSDGRVAELVDIKATSPEQEWDYRFEDDYLYVAGGESVASVSLEDGWQYVLPGLQAPSLAFMQDGAMIVNTELPGSERSDRFRIYIPAKGGAQAAVLRVPEDIGRDYFPWEFMVVDGTIWASSLFFQDAGGKYTTMPFSAENGYPTGSLPEYVEYNLTSRWTERTWATRLSVRSPNMPLA